MWQDNWILILKNISKYVHAEHAHVHKIAAEVWCHRLPWWRLALLAVLRPVFSVMYPCCHVVNANKHLYFQWWEVNSQDTVEVQRIQIIVGLDHFILYDIHCSRNAHLTIKGSHPSITIHCLFIVLTLQCSLQSSHLQFIPPRASPLLDCVSASYDTTCSYTQISNVVWEIGLLWETGVQSERVIFEKVS